MQLGDRNQRLAIGIDQVGGAEHALGLRLGRATRQHFTIGGGQIKRAADTMTRIGRLDLIAVISYAATGRDIALVPMISRSKGGVRIVEFADLGVSDNNAPALALDSACDAAGARAIGDALVNGLRALPDRFDLSRLQKMSAYLGGKPNPLLSLGRVGSCGVGERRLFGLTHLDQAHATAALLASLQPLRRRAMSTSSPA